MVVIRRTYVWRRCRAARFVLTELYWLNLVLTSLSTVTSSWKLESVSNLPNAAHGRHAPTDLLECVYELAQRLVGPVSDLVPAKAAEVLVVGSARKLSARRVWVDGAPAGTQH